MIHRLAYAAAHVVMRDSYASVAHAPDAPGDADEIAEQVDWHATAALRRRIASHGFGIAEAMDTAQRFELGWTAAERLIRVCGVLDLDHGFCAGASTDHLPRVDDRVQLVDGVVKQCALIRSCGGVPVILPMPMLSIEGATEDEYVDVYASIIDQSDGPLVVHWLGPMFLAVLEGYFPGASFDRIMAHDPEKVRGAKLSLLDADLERRHRRALLERDQLLLTGDDFNFADLIAGDDPEVLRTTTLGGREVALGDFSHALLGILDGIAEPAGRALVHLANGERDAYDALMRPCETLSRIVFESPTQHYKVGLALLAWLGGHQANPMLVNHAEACRDREHLERVVEAAFAAGVLSDAEITRSRLDSWREAV